LHGFKVYFIICYASVVVHGIACWLIIIRTFLLHVTWIDSWWFCACGFLADIDVDWPNTKNDLFFQKSVHMSSGNLPIFLRNCLTVESYPLSVT